MKNLGELRSAGLWGYELEGEYPDDWNHLKIGAQGDYLAFVNCNYLGLEHDPIVKQYAKDYTDAYGVAISICPQQVRTPPALEHLRLCQEVFDHPHCVIDARVTLAHMAVLPCLVEAARARTILVDQFAHYTLQAAAAMTRLPIRSLRHSDMAQLEETLSELPAGEPVLYLADGIYSMTGDRAPVAEILALMERFPALHVYFDDAHGGGWAGDKGVGFVWPLVKGHPRVTVCQGLGKGLGVMGACTLLPDAMLEAMMKSSGPQIFTHALSPPMIGASIAVLRHVCLDPSRMSAIQAEFADKIDFLRDG
ncbi:MAG TPA: aminotransferase class I/II-fold pyridoxal phosphate-dependent enzyme, partial [Archangium sp.]